MSADQGNQTACECWVCEGEGADFYWLASTERQAEYEWVKLTSGEEEADRLFVFGERSAASDEQKGRP